MDSLERRDDLNEPLCSHVSSCEAASSLRNESVFIQITKTWFQHHLRKHEPQPGGSNLIRGASRDPRRAKINHEEEEEKVPAHMEEVESMLGIKPDQSLISFYSASDLEPSHDGNTSL